MNAVTTTESTALAQRGMGFDLSPQTFEQALTFAKYLAESEMVPKQYRGRPGDCLIAMQWGHEIGLKPLQALQSIAAVNGKPSLYGDAGKAMLLAKGCKIEEDDTEQIRATGIARCRITRPGRGTTERTFSVEDAKTAQLWGKVGPWTTSPYRQMAWRAFWFSARDAAADLLRGMGGAEEAADYATERHMGMAEEVTPAAPKPTAPPPEWAADRWANGLAKWVDGIVNGGKSIEDVLAWLRSKATVSEAQEKQLRDEVAKHSQQSAPSVNPDELAKAMQDASDLDTLYELASRMDAIEDIAQRQRVGAIFDARVAELEGQQ